MPHVLRQSPNALHRSPIVPLSQIPRCPRPPAVPTGAPLAGSPVEPTLTRTPEAGYTFAYHDGVDQTGRLESVSVEHGDVPVRDRPPRECGGGIHLRPQLHGYWALVKRLACVDRPLE